MKTPAPDTSGRSPRRLALGAAAMGAALVATALLPATAGASSLDESGAAPGELTRVVSSQYPASGPAEVQTREDTALRPAGVLAGARSDSTELVDAKPHPWEELVTVAGVVMDIDFVTPKIGYAAAELGVVWKTEDGGSSWTQLVNVGFPYYFYGVEALSKDEVVVSGFNNSAAFDQSAIVWRTLDGGDSWTSDITMGPGWGWRVRFADKEHGLIGGLIGSTMWHTATGGETEGEWTYEQPAPDDGWFAGQFTLLKNLRAYASGISFCRSGDGGASWGCEDSVDEVFDGPTSFVSSKTGWVGGGTISPQVEGWLHRTTDGGDTWSDRVLQTTYPIRHIEALDKKRVWAVGGSSGVGGMSYSGDGGKTWGSDLTTDNELTSCDHLPVKKGKADRIWCVGFSGAGGWHSDFYKLTVPRT